MTAPFAPELLRVPTPSSWLERACASPEVLLIDHANCEKKAASTALALMFAYAEDLELTARMSRVAREELRHYEQVAKLIRSLEIAPQRLSPGRYAEGLRRLVAKGEPQREIDLMICGAFIEARSCERFAKLAEHLITPAGAPLKDLFASLHAAEARHYQLYLGLARRAAARAKASELEVLPIEARIEEFAELEADLITRPDALFRFHSGTPDDGPI
jgi:tRNA-(ms[2]io[6]A)-hydroxylase